VKVRGIAAAAAAAAVAAAAAAVVAAARLMLSPCSTLASNYWLAQYFDSRVFWG